MKRRIHTFNTYLNEQEKTSNADLLGGLNAGEMAKGMLAMALDQFLTLSKPYVNSWLSSTLHAAALCGQTVCIGG